MASFSELTSYDLMGLYYRGFETSMDDAFFPKLCNIVTSTQEAEDYSIVGGAPGLAASASGKLQITRPKTYPYTLTNLNYNGGVEYTRAELRRDKTGQLASKFEEAGRKAAIQPDEALTTLITANGTGADGVAFFHGSHAWSGTNQSNLLTSSEVATLDVNGSTAPTAVEFSRALGDILAYMLAYTDDKGNYLNSAARSFLVMTGGASLWRSAVESQTSVQVDSGATNPFTGLARRGFTIDPVYNPRLAATPTVMYVFRTDGNKPFIFQDEYGVRQEMLGDDSEYASVNDSVLMIERATRAVGYWDPFSAVKATFS